MIVSVLNAIGTTFEKNRGITVSVPRFGSPRRATPNRSTSFTFLADEARNWTSTLSPTFTGVLPGDLTGRRMLTVATPPAEGGVGLPGVLGPPPPPLVTPYRPDCPHSNCATAHPATSARRA